MDDKNNAQQEDVENVEDAEDVKLQGESIDEAPSASDTSLTDTIKKSSKEARSGGNCFFDD
jgi:hypothetical protein